MEKLESQQKSVKTPVSSMMTAHFGENAVVPPASPVWFPAAMGTGILTTLLTQHIERIPFAVPLSIVSFLISWTVLIYLTGSFLQRCIRQPDVLKEAFINPAISTFWGTVSMGYLAVGTASAATIATHLPAYAMWGWRINLVMWIIGVTIGLISAFTFVIRIVSGTLGAPNFTWGLAVVGPMVASTSGANLSNHINHAIGPYVLTMSMFCFVVSFTLGWCIFIAAYRQFWFKTPLPLVASASAWIPLGLVGQSSAAMQGFVRNIQVFATGPMVTGLTDIANFYGWTMFVVGTPLTAWATYTTLRGLKQRMPFSPGWWATTFPIGTMALGATAMAAGTGVSALLWVGAVNTLVLCCTVAFAGISSCIALTYRHRR